MARRFFLHRRSLGTTISVIVMMLLVPTMQNCSGAGGDGSSGGGSAEWYYHWNCHGDAQCLSLNSACGSGPNGTCPEAGTADEGPGAFGASACRSLMQFSYHFYGGSAVDACDNSSTWDGGGGAGGGTPPPIINSFSPSTGAPGDTVTINGSGFPSIPSQVTVLINGGVATVVSVNATTIVVTIPALSPSVGQVIVNTSGGAYVAAGSFTVTGSLVPSLYWAEHNASGTIKTVAKSNGVPTTLAYGLSYPGQIAVDATHVYWLEFDSMGNTSGSIKKISRQGGAVTTLASGLTDLSNGAQIAVDANGVYWVANSSINKVSLDGGPVSALASGSGFGTALAIDSVNAYYTANGNLNKVPLSGGAVTPLLSGVTNGTGNGFAIAVDATYVYLVDDTDFAGSGTLKKVPIAGGSATTLIATGLMATSMALDSTNVYLLGEAIGAGNTVRVQKIAKTGGSVTTLSAPAGMYPQLLAIDNSGMLYWTQAGSNTAGNVAKVPVTGGGFLTYGLNLFLPVGLFVDP